MKRIIEVLAVSLAVGFAYAAPAALIAGGVIFLLTGLDGFGPAIRGDMGRSALISLGVAWLLIALLTAADLLLEPPADDD